MFPKSCASMVLLAVAMGTLVDADSYLIMGGLTPISYERVDSIIYPGIVSYIRKRCRDTR